MPDMSNHQHATTPAKVRDVSRRIGTVVALASILLTALATATGVPAPAFAVGARTLQTTPVARLTTAAAHSVGAMVVDSATHRAFTVDKVTRKIVVVDTSGTAVTLLGTITAGSDPTGLALNATTSQLLVTDKTDETVSVIDVDPGSPTTGTVLATIPTLGSGSAGIAVDDVLNLAYVASSTSPVLSTVNIAGRSATAGAVAALVGDLSVDSTAHLVYLALPTANAVVSINRLNGDVTTTAMTGSPTALFWAGDRLLVGLDAPAAPTRFFITAFDPSMTAVATSSPLADAVTGLSVDTGLGIAFARVSGGDVDALDLRSLELDPSSPVIPETVATAAFDQNAHRLVTARSGVAGATIADYDVAASPLITTTSPPSGKQGVPYSFTIGSVARPAATFSATGSLPDGLQLDAGTGEIHGTPTTLGAFAFTITAGNAVGSSAPTRFEIIIDPVQITPTITSGPPPGATVGRSYSFFVTADGSPAPSFAVSFGSLPDGLRLNSASGEISGTPTASGTSGFTVSATNPLGADSKEYTLAVTAGTPTPTATATPSPTASPAPTPTATTSAPPVPPTTTTGSDTTRGGGGAPSGPLAQTGTAAMWSAGIAIASILAGLACYGGVHLRRRRRARLQG